jgi:hypothetical protein
MSQQNPIRLFVAHVWEDSEDYLRIFEYLESARNFYYRNSSTPEHKPGTDPEARREDLRRQIGPAELLIASANLYRSHPDLLMFQVNFAKSANKPVLVLRPFGVNAVVAKALVELADDVVDWEERGLVDAIRRLARHENTARYDTIEFNADEFKDFKLDGE